MSDDVLISNSHSTLGCKLPKNFGLYMIISNPKIAYTTIAEICVKHNIKYLQLREKQDKPGALSDRDLLVIAREIKSITKDSNTIFIINDRVDICLLSEADGVHLGQSNFHLAEVKKILPKEKVIGLSTHSILQVDEAIKDNPDYIGYGPIYSTPTKSIPDPVVGCDSIYKVVKMSHIPVVVIGGIDENNINHVLSAGAQNICMVRYFMQCDTIEFENRIIKTKELFENY